MSFVFYNTAVQIYMRDEAKPRLKTFNNQFIVRDQKNLQALLLPLTKSPTFEAKKRPLPSLGLSV